MARGYRRDWRGRFAGGGGGGGRPSGGRVKTHGRNRKAGTIQSATRRNSRNSVSVVQRSSGRGHRVKQTTVRRASRLPLTRRRARHISAAATSGPAFKRGQSRLVVTRRSARQTRIPRRNVYVVTADN